MSKDALRRYLKVNKARMRDFYALVESYEGLATLRTVDVAQSIVEVDISPDFIEVFELLLDDLGREISISEVQEPPSCRS
jgi:hypothetical protein